MLALCLVSLLSFGQLPTFPLPVKIEPQKSLPGTTLDLRIYDKPRPLRVWRLRLDLKDPDLSQTTTKAGPAGRTVKTEGRNGREVPAETLSQTTLDFAQSEGLDIAVNASPFLPVVKLSGQPLDIQGLHLREHQVISPPLGNYACWTLGPDHDLRFFRDRPPAGLLSKAMLGLGGFGMVVVDGTIVEKPGPKDALHPRTALGLEQDPRSGNPLMVWLVIDGRQSRVSEGVSLNELGLLGKQLGLSQLINLDGGGSTTLVVRDPEGKGRKGKPRVVNRTVGIGNIPGTLRPNGNNWGVWRIETSNGVPSSVLKGMFPWLTESQLLQVTGPINNALRHLGIQDPEGRAIFLSILAMEGGPLAAPESEGPKSGRAPWPPGRISFAGLVKELNSDEQTVQELVGQPEGQVLATRWWWQANNPERLHKAGVLRMALGLSETQYSYWEKTRTRLWQRLRALQAGNPGG